MTKKDSKKNAIKKTNYRKRYKNQSLKIPKRLIGKTKMVSLPFCNLIQLDPGAGTASQQIYRANSVFDPNYTSGAVGHPNHQPRGRDEMFTLYNKATVMGHKITVTACNDGNAGAVILALSYNQNYSAKLDILDIVEKDEVNYTVLGPKNAQPLKTINRNFSTTKFFDKKDLVDEEDFTETSTTGPALNSTAYCHLHCAALDYSTDSSAVSALVRIDYLVMFHDPIELDKS